MPPLDGLLVLDFSTLLPGPLAGLMLAEAGAGVVKVERPGRGDEMRGYEPKVDADSANFHILNRGKRSIAIDLKAADAHERLRPLIARADILIEQFRPGVMASLGLDPAAVHAINPRLIYCSITGWGQSGPKAQVAAHDLNFMAESGLLGLTGGADGAPVLPPILAADIAGGAMPAVMNILLALRERDRSGQGATLDIAMSDTLFTFAYWGLADAAAGGGWPERGKSLVTGGSARYNIYPTRDGRHLAVAAMEDRFWRTFCGIVGLDPAIDEDGISAAIGAVGKRIATRTAAEWKATFAGHDVCCSVVASLEEACADPHPHARGVLGRMMPPPGAAFPVLPLPIVPQFRSGRATSAAPALGEYPLA